MTPTFDISPAEYLGSTLGNALFSGLDLSQVFEAAKSSASMADFDAAVSATILLRDICARGERPETTQERGTHMLESDTTSRRINLTPQPAPAKVKPLPKMAMALTIPTDDGNIEVRSHAPGRPYSIAITHAETGLAATLTREDAESLIDGINTVLSHLQ